MAPRTGPAASARPNAAGLRLNNETRNRSFTSSAILLPKRGPSESCDILKHLPVAPFADRGIVRQNRLHVPVLPNNRRADSGSLGIGRLDHESVAIHPLCCRFRSLVPIHPFFSQTPPRGCGAVCSQRQLAVRTWFQSSTRQRI